MAKISAIDEELTEILMSEREIEKFESYWYQSEKEPKEDIITVFMENSAKMKQFIEENFKEIAAAEAEAEK